MKANLFLLYFLLTIVFISCADESETPVFITMKPPAIEIPTERGSDFQIIEEYYLFHRTSLLGGFSYDQAIPVLADGNEDILIFPGIRVNAVKEQPDIYSMMDPDTLRRTFTPGDAIEFKPTFRYRNQVNFKILEDFETGNGFLLDIDDNSNTTLVRTLGRGYNNTAGGVLAVTADDRFNEIAWSESLSNFPLTGDVIVEITYKSNIELRVGILASSPLIGTDINYKLGLFPSAEWNKVYVDIAPEIRSSNKEEIRLLFGASYDIANVAGEVILDDIKLLHLQ
jgi:hypothetical protein